MAPQKCSPYELRTPPQLLHRWQAWADGVARFVASPRRAKISDEQYEDLNLAVLDAIEACRHDAQGSDLEVLQKLEAFASPWTTLEAIRQARREIRGDLLRRCREIEHCLGGRGTAPFLRRWHVYGIAITSTIAAVVLMVTYRPSAAVTAPATIRHLVYQFGLLLEHASATDKLMTFTLATLLVGWWFIRSMRES